MNRIMLAAVVDATLFEKCLAKNYYSCYGKELAIGATYVLSKLKKCLPKF